jgi:hypothetical protein
MLHPLDDPDQHLHVYVTFKSITLLLLSNKMRSHCLAMPHQKQLLHLPCLSLLSRALVPLLVCACITQVALQTRHQGATGP